MPTGRIAGLWNQPAGARVLHMRDRSIDPSEIVRACVVAPPETNTF